MKATIGKHGPKHDYRGAHVAITYQGRDWLGTIREVTYNHMSGCIVCKVQHFCGDWWPFEPRLMALEILERTYEEA